MKNNIDIRPTIEETNSKAVIECYNKLKEFVTVPYLCYQLGCFVQSEDGKERIEVFKYALRIMSKLTEFLGIEKFVE